MVVMSNGVTDKLRRLADDLDTGQYREWLADMTLSPPTNGDSDPGEVREFREGDEITIVLVLTAPKKRERTS